MTSDGNYISTGKALYEKGISPLVATILIIALTVGVVGIVAVWLTGFTRTTTDTVSTQSGRQIECSFGAVSVDNLKFANNFLSGRVENRGQIALGNISVNIIYQNASTEKFELCKSGSTATRCDGGNLSLLVSEQSSFNVTIGGSNYDTIRVFTNCTGVSDTAQRGDVG